MNVKLRCRSVLVTYQEHITALTWWADTSVSVNKDSSGSCVSMTLA